MPAYLNVRRLAVSAVVLAAVLPYVPTLDNYFAHDDFGVVGLLALQAGALFPAMVRRPVDGEHLGIHTRRAPPVRGLDLPVYLASVGWAISLGIAFEVMWQAPHARDEADRGDCCRCRADRIHGSTCR
jgi:hypothetical protein